MRNEEVYKWFEDFFAQRGFKKHGRYIIKTDKISVFSFSFECTNTNSVYFRYAYFPLFIPADYFHYDYGGRLEQIIRGKTSLCMPYESNASVNKWIKLIKETVDSHLLPLFGEIENPYILQSMLLKGRPKEFKGSILSKYELLISLCVMLGNYSKDLTSLLNIAISEVNNSQISESIKKRFEVYCKGLISIAFNSEDERLAYFQNIIDTTKQKVFGL